MFYMQSRSREATATPQRRGVAASIRLKGKYAPKCLIYKLSFYDFRLTISSDEFEDLNWVYLTYSMMNEL